jgi:hypothetical protein
LLLRREQHREVYGTSIKADGVCDPSTPKPFIAMFRRKINKHCLEVYAGASWWSIHLLPSIEVSRDNEGVYVSINFIAYFIAVSIYDIEKQKKWEDKFL